MPNLELMKVYNYHYQNNDLVTLLKPKDDTSRFSKIIYFKDSPNSTIPKKCVSNDKTSIYGQGFYNYFEPLDKKYSGSPPSFLPYDLVSDKIIGVDYNHLKRSSIIRLENQDFTGFDEKLLGIYIVDQDFCRLDYESFLREFHNHNFFFYYAPICHTIEQFDKIKKFFNIMRERVRIEFQYNGDFVKEYKSKVIFPMHNIQNETDEQAAIRITKTILTIKKDEQNLSQIHSSKKFTYLIKWGAAKKICSYFDYYKNNNKALDFLNTSSTELRLLLKTNPKSGIFDF